LTGEKWGRKSGGKVGVEKWKSEGKLKTNRQFRNFPTASLKKKKFQQQAKQKKLQYVTIFSGQWEKWRKSGGKVEDRAVG